MNRIFRIVLLACMLFAFVSNAFSDPEDYPDTIEIGGIVYEKVVIDGEIYYESNGYYYVYNPELGEMMEAEITFPY